MQAPKFKILSLSKDSMKFSAAHFLIFDETRAERLHGHNYRVRVRIKIDWDTSIFTNGFGIDFSFLKADIKRAVDLWDERVLLPSLHPDIKISVVEQSLLLKFRERTYMFPENEVVLLPIINTSVELLSDQLSQHLWQMWQSWKVLGIEVEVEETQGQSAISTLGLW